MCVLSIKCPYEKSLETYFNDPRIYIYIYYIYIYIYIYTRFMVLVRSLDKLMED